MAHSHFDLYKRKSKTTGRVWIYYRAYDMHGNRLSGRSTGIEYRGERSIARARTYCEDLYKANQLHRSTSLLFETYARDWYKWDICPYVADRRASGTLKRPGITPGYARQMRAYLENHLIPYFGKMVLSTINPVKIRAFRVWLQGSRTINGTPMDPLSNKTINNICSCLRIMTDWALDNDQLIKNPFRGIDQLMVDDDTRGAFTEDQVKEILLAPWPSEIARKFALVAAVTGMREGEVRGIRRESLHPNYIDVDKQYSRAGLSELKTKDARKVPICRELYDLLDEMIGPKVYAFDNGEGQPYGINYLVSRNFTLVMKKLFPDEKGLVFHSFRHFYNTYLLSKNVPREKVDAVIGHSKGKGSMSELYTHWKPEMMPEVYEAHKKITLFFTKIVLYRENGDIIFFNNKAQNL